MRILFISSRFPYPLEKGDKLRTYEFLKLLAKNHEVYLFAFNDQAPPLDYGDLRLFCKHITVHHLSRKQIAWNLLSSLFSHKPFQVGYFRSKEATQKLNKLINSCAPEVIFNQLIRTTEYGREANTNKVLDYMDAMSKGMERRLNTDTFPKRLFVQWEYKRLKKYERDIAQYYQRHLVISRQDADALPLTDKSRLEVIPNGVDKKYYFPRVLPKAYDLIFQGNMAYPPNIESARYLVQEIMPLVWKSRPETTLLISGATPDPAVLALASEKVTIGGWEDDARVVYWKSKILVAPMLISIGLQNKILQAMAMKIPVIMSELANNAIHAPETSAVVARNTQEFAESICQLLDDEPKRAEMAEMAYQFVNENYSWEKVGNQLNALLESLPGEADR
jgi:sugar transferase (PEP-CTERM/EpsH1 system associated)